MDGHSLPPAWLELWVSRVSGALAVMADEFEHRHGFPPGTNQVRRADRGDQAAAHALAQLDHAPADLVTFYDSIADVTWGDVGNGYFIHPVPDVLLCLEEYGAVPLGTGQDACGLVIGSNGGGQSYVTDPDGAVHRTRTASLDAPELDRVADDLRHFLQLLEQSLTRFLASGEPGHL
ncbi:SMI1/KNR4 family protein [Streptomyces sp. NBC_00019]|uniref:SMI1/KNR4 family protein n=1 Tax=Streptomyces sp. NBC_00019 TaxID=2975623 RepID=UPI0032544B83